MRRTVFLDRDGTLNAEVSFVARPDQLVVLPGVRQALQRLRETGHRLIVVTNQSGVARGLYGERELARVHDRLRAEVGDAIDAILHCPHHPDLAGPYGGRCACRKPAPGLLHQAAELFDLDLAGSALIGDSARDLLMARGIPMTTVYVHSGKPPADELALLAAAGVTPSAQAPDLAGAVDWLLQQA